MIHKALIAVTLLVTTGCAPFWQVNRIEDKVDRLVQSTNRSTLSEIFGEKTTEVMRRMDRLSQDERDKLDELIAEYERGSSTLDEIASVMGGGEREVATARGIYVRNEEGQKLKPIPRGKKITNCRRIVADDLPEPITERKYLMAYNGGSGELDGETVVFPWDLTMSSFAKEIVENTAKRTAEEFIKLGGSEAFQRPIQIQITTEAADGKVKISHAGEENEIYVTTDKAKDEGTEAPEGEEK